MSVRDPSLEYYLPIKLLKYNSSEVFKDPSLEYVLFIYLII